MNNEKLAWLGFAIQTQIGSYVACWSHENDKIEQYVVGFCAFKYKLRNIWWGTDIDW